MKSKKCNILLVLRLVHHDLISALHDLKLVLYNLRVKYWSQDMRVLRNKIKLGSLQTRQIELWDHYLLNPNRLRNTNVRFVGLYAYSQCTLLAITCFAWNARRKSFSKECLVRYADKASLTHDRYTFQRLIHNCKLRSQRNSDQSTPGQKLS